MTTKDFAPKLVRLPSDSIGDLKFGIVSVCLIFSNFYCSQVDALKHELDIFYGKDPLQSKDLSRIVNSNHYARLTKLLDEDKVSGKIIHGGERDKSNL